MIAGQYQPIAQECKDYLDYNTAEVVEYEIVHDDSSMTFRVYPELDVVDIGNDVFQTVADSRTIWDDFMKIGWRKVISTTSEVNA